MNPENDPRLAFLADAKRHRPVRYAIAEILLVLGVAMTIGGSLVTLHSCVNAYGITAIFGLPILVLGLISWFVGDLLKKP